MKTGRKTGVALACWSAVVCANVAAAQDQVLVILADDLGVEQLAAYRPDASGLVPTPAIDEIAAHGITFRNAWVNPLCSPTRATIQTGKYACRTGIGNVVESQCPNYSLPNGGELPALLPGLQTSAFGKWHLEDQTQVDPLAPWSHGYDYFEGTLWAVPYVCGPIPKRPCNPALIREGTHYFEWLHTTIDLGQRSTRWDNEYMPGAVFDAAATWIGSAGGGDWFTYLAPQAPFELQHCPPAELQGEVNCPPCSAAPQCPPGIYTNGGCYRASLQAFDAKVGSILRALDGAGKGPWWKRTTVIFVGDNGTGLRDTGFWPVGQGKGSLFNGGIHAPLIIAGPAVANEDQGRTTEAIANGVDVFATVLDLAGEPLPQGVDGVSLLPVLADPDQSVRNFIYTERFQSNGPPPYAKHFKAVADAGYDYKLRRAGDDDYFYRLAPDPAEPNGPKRETLICSGGACTNLPAAEASKLQELQGVMDAICP